MKKNPGKLDYGSAGNASAGHLAMEYLKMVTGMFITHIPYRGTGPQLTDLLAGRTQATSAGLPALLPHIKAGKLRAIAVGTAQRLHLGSVMAFFATMPYGKFAHGVYRAAALLKWAVEKRLPNPVQLGSD